MGDLRDEDLDDPIDRFDSSTVQPPHFVPARHRVLTPMGEVESTGSFARGLGARRVKWMIGIAGVLALVLAALNALR